MSLRPTTCLLLLLHAGCASSAIELFEQCEITIVVTPESASAGAEVTARGGPLTDVRDTQVRVGGFTAEVLAVDANTTIPKDTATVDLTSLCNECQTCRAEALCAPCGRCVGERLTPTRRVQCFGDTATDPITSGVCDLCEQRAVFVVPDAVPPGATTVQLTNRHGSSAGVPFVVERSPGESTGGTADTATGSTPSTPPTSKTGDTASQSGTGS